LRVVQGCATAPGAPEGEGVKIGYNTWSMATVPYATFIPELAKIGFRSLAISVVPGYPIAGQWVENAGDFTKWDAADKARIRSLMVTHGLELASIVGNQPIIGDEQDRAEAAIARLRDTIDLCAELALPHEGPPALNCGSGGSPAQFETHRQQLVDRLGGLIDHAASRGVTVCIEPHVGAAIDTPDRSEWLVREIDHPHLALDFDVSHFEVVNLPLEATVPRLAPLSKSVEIKDQHMRYLDAPEPEGWRVEGNGVGQAVAPDGRPVEFQFLLAGEGTFDLPRYLRLLDASGWRGAVGFEASVQCQARPGYDALAWARRIFTWMDRGWTVARISRD
jgi:sugar phosphate isomerase/epimerase